MVHSLYPDSCGFPIFPIPYAFVYHLVFYLSRPSISFWDPDSSLRYKFYKIQIGHFSRHLFLLEVSASIQLNTPLSTFTPFFFHPPLPSHLPTHQRLTESPYSSSLTPLNFSSWTSGIHFDFMTQASPYLSPIYPFFSIYLLVLCGQEQWPQSWSPF